MSDEDKLRSAVEDAAVDGKVGCEVLLELAERTGAPAAQIGRLCDEMKIRIGSCQLGCFQ